MDTEYGVITSLEDLESLREPWLDLGSQGASVPPSLDPDWLISWCLAYDGSSALRVYWYREGARFKAILPMMLNPGQRPDTIGFLADCCSDYQGGIFATSNLKAIQGLFSLMEQDRSWNEIRFANIRDDHNSLDILSRVLCNAGYSPLIQKHETAFYVPDLQNWKGKDSLHSRNFRHDFNKKMAAIKKLGQLRFVEVSAYEPDLLEVTFAMHSRRWESVGKAPSFADERRRQFVHNIAKRFSDRGLFRVFCLFLDSTLISYRMGLLKGEVFYDWNTSFSLAHAKSSPGMLNMGHILDTLSKDGITEFDFMRGDEQYKHKWTDAARSLYSIDCQRPPHTIKRRAPSPSKSSNTLTGKACVILDLDGVVYRGDTPLETTIEAIAELQQQQIRIGYLTNTSVMTTTDLAHKLARFGVLCSEREIMTSSIAVRDHLIKSDFKSALVLGGRPALPDLLLDNHIEVFHRIRDRLPDVIVIGYTTSFSYRDLLDVQRALDNGASLVCTDRDLLFAHKGMNRPGTGWIVSAIQAVFGVEPFVAGKPNAYPLLLILQQLEVSREAAVLVGDSLETDIRSAKNAGVTSCLLLGGVSTMTDVFAQPADARPDFIIRDLREFVNLIKREPYVKEN